MAVSRQSLSAIESGRSAPATDLALQIARVLGCRLDELFWLEGHGGTLEVERTTPGARLALGLVQGRWVAHPIDPTDTSAADALVAHGQSVTLLSRREDVAQTLLCAGCAPAMGLLASRTPRARWLERSSTAALELLHRGQVHVAGAHLFDETTHEFNLPHVRRRFPNTAMRVVTLARWEAGLVLPHGNPHRVRHARQLSKLRIVQREPGSGAEALLARALEGHLPKRRGPDARGHFDAARAVLLGAADAAVAVAGAAEAFGLHFVPLAEERFDLIYSAALESDERLKALLDTLTGRAFRRELQSLGGYQVRETGRALLH